MILELPRRISIAWTVFRSSWGQWLFFFNYLALHKSQVQSIQFWSCLMIWLLLVLLLARVWSWDLLKNQNHDNWIWTELIELEIWKGQDNWKKVNYLVLGNKFNRLDTELHKKQNDASENMIFRLTCSFAVANTKILQIANTFLEHKMFSKCFF